MTFVQSYITTLKTLTRFGTDVPINQSELIFEAITSADLFFRQNFTNTASMGVFPASCIVVAAILGTNVELDVANHGMSVVVVTAPPFKGHGGGRERVVVVVVRLTSLKEEPTWSSVSEATVKPGDV